MAICVSVVGMSFMAPKETPIPLCFNSYYADISPTQPGVTGYHSQLDATNAKNAFKTRVQSQFIVSERVYPGTFLGFNVWYFEVCYEYGFH